MGRLLKIYGFCVPSLFVFLLGLSSCGPSIEGERFYEAARRQYSLDTKSLQLFERGPTWDGQNAALTATSNLNTVPKTFVPLFGLESLSGSLKGFNEVGLGGYGLQVFYSRTSLQSPVFNTWAGSSLQWDSKEFKAFMLYAHLSRAYETVFSKMPSILTLVDEDNYRLKGYSQIPGSILNTSFTYGTGGLAVNFYQHNQKSLAKLNMVDEADAIYHEYAHYIQNIYNPTLLSTAVSRVSEGAVVNPDLDAIIEGTADYFAAAMTKSEAINVYLDNNLPLVRSGQVNREGTSNRSISRNWKFPEAYMFLSHFDGRVVSSTLNDLRKYLSNQVVPLVGCTPLGAPACEVRFSHGTSELVDTWITAFEISMMAMTDMSSDSTYRDFGVQLLAKGLQRVSTLTACGGACQTEFSTEFAQILKTRGLISTTGVTPYSYPAILAEHLGTGADKKIRIGTTFGYVPFEQARGLSNADGKLSECEMVVAFPSLINNTNAVGPITDFYNIHYKVKTTSNVQEVRDAQNKIIDHLSGDALTWRFWGLLAPGESGLSNLSASTSKWFRTVGGSHFAKQATLSHFPVPYGYLISVPANRQGSNMSITWDIVMYAKNSDTTNSKVNFEVTQTQPILADDEISFCF